MSIQQSDISPAGGVTRAVLRATISSRRVRRIILFLAVGAVAGLLAAGYSHSLDWLTGQLQGGLAGMRGTGHPGESTLLRPWVLPLMTTFVGALTGWLVSRFAPEAANAGTDGTDAMIRAFHQGRGRIRPLTAVLRTLTSILTMASGGSAGKEGPVAFMGAGFGAWVAERMSLTDKERRILLLAGAAAGLGAIFHAPLGGALTAVEVLYSEDFEGEALLPAIVSSVTAYTISSLFLGTAPFLEDMDLVPMSLMDAPFYLLLALACAGSAWLYVRSFFLIKYKVFRKISGRLGLPLCTALGGLLMGCVGMAFPELLGASHSSLELAVLGKLPAAALLALLLGKVLATSMTIGSGFSGGMFAPGLFVGGMTGGLAAKACEALGRGGPELSGSFVLVGMSAFFGCAAKAPIGPIIMVCEITQGYVLLAPLMLCTAVSLMLSGSFCLYENQVRSKFDSPAHRDGAVSAALQQLTVGDVFMRCKAVVLEESTTLAALSDIVSNTEDVAFPVRGADGSITGLLDVRDVRPVIFEKSLYPLLVVRDLARPPVLLVPEQDLHQALMSFVESRTDQLPVVDPDDRSTILGFLTMRALLAAPREETG
ncbi:chloride channel protein [Fundidesulfovibrio soli]|uniref:chloride channel protein n=1 Tax=Fundidesulfovibrio soli TaxID=2922716 RepID=UPI001FB03A61|nr:chloride channel protein [Fundidesulfovibrio soli]